MKVVLKQKLSPDLQKQAQVLDKAAFGRDKEDDAQVSLHNDQYHSLDLARKGYVLGFDKNELIGRVIVYQRTVNFGGNKLVLGGLGGVCTSPARQRQGIATKLLKRAVLELKKANCEVAYLCTDVYNPGMVKLYGQFGFVLLAKKHTYLGKSGKRYVDKDGMIAPVKSKAKFKQILASKRPLDIGAGNW